jgi:phage antirepressor YoqD-like protein
MTPPRGTLSLQEAGKALFCDGFDTGPDKIFDQLRAAGVLMFGTARPVPYQLYLTRGWFVVEDGTWTHPITREEQPYCRTFVTAKGLREIARLMPRPAIRESRTVRPAIKPMNKQQWQPQVELNWPVCVLGM